MRIPSVIQYRPVVVHPSVREHLSQRSNPAVRSRPWGRALLTCALVALGACGGEEPDIGAELDRLDVAPALDPLPDTAQPPPVPDSLRPDEAGPLAAVDTLPAGGVDTTVATAPPDTGAAAPPDTGAAAPDTATTWTAGVEDGGSARTGTAILTGLRVGRHADFDRIVLEFAEGPVPRYHLEYVDRPVRQCGSGNVIPLPGDGWLSIRLEDTRGHDDAGRATVDHAGREAGLPNLLHLTFACDFEAVVEVVAAVRSPEPFRVVVLREPARLVVDVRHPGGGAGPGGASGPPPAPGLTPPGAAPPGGR
ncbi:MAG: hypothetical protein WEA24_08510 [Gemmatimonadota bacterium]